MSCWEPFQGSQTDVFPCTEFELIKSSAAADIAKMAAARKRREDEDGYRKRRKDVGELYEELKNAGSEAPPLPPLSDFRKLPMVQRIQYKPDNAPSAAVARELRQSSITLHLVNEEITQWRESAKTALGKVLGFETGEKTDAEMLLPVNRLTARFRCKKCDTNGRSKGWDNMSLDFAAACQHRCRGTKRECAKETWQAGNFVPDSQVRQLELSRICVDAAAHVLRQ